MLFAPNLAWRDVDLKAELEERVDLPVVIENDANAAAWGEFRYGAGHDVDDLLLVTVGTGVGGGLVLDGELYRGAFGVAAEIGHLRVVPDGVLCGCGHRGCFEQYASGTALVRDVRDLAAGQSTRSDGLLERAGGRVEAIDGPMITSAAREGDPFAIERLAELGHWLGAGHRLPGDRARPGRGRDRRRRERGRRAAAGARRARPSTATCPGASTGRSPRSARPPSATPPG